jgi:type VI secretion system protein ImpL
MSREEMIRAAEKLMTFYVAQAGAAELAAGAEQGHPGRPTRQALGQVMRASRRWSACTRRSRRAPARASHHHGRQPDRRRAQWPHDQGSYAISGAFSRKAGRVRAGRDQGSGQHAAEHHRLGAGTTEQSDLSLAGSPEHVSRELVNLYKNDYAREWTKFLQGLSVAEFSTFDEAVARINAGRCQQFAAARAAGAHQRRDRGTTRRRWPAPARRARGFVAWFQRTILRKDPAAAAAAQPVGPIGKAFEGIARLTSERGDQPAVITAYFDTLAKLRASERDQEPGRDRSHPQADAGHLQQRGFRTERGPGAGR